MGNVHSSATEMRKGLQDNGHSVERGTKDIGHNILEAGNRLGSGADNIAAALYESAIVGKEVATAHKLVGQSIPECGLWLGAAGICGSVWIAAGHNLQLTRYATRITTLYTLTAATVFGVRAYTKQQYDKKSVMNNQLATNR